MSGVFWTNLISRLTSREDLGLWKPTPHKRCDRCGRNVFDPVHQGWTSGRYDSNLDCYSPDTKIKIN